MVSHGNVLILFPSGATHADHKSVRKEFCHCKTLVGMSFDKKQTVLCLFLAILAVQLCYQATSLVRTKMMAKELGLT